ncbi:hypothetical protein [Bradyrhizobium sp.]|uniref:hypothetical protein n=2 Tax=Nitrobacteraceae TaxID=41294 RepID=UPI0025BD5209|nr:hypothetical protein [Bradyrhizobium sp.]
MTKERQRPRIISSRAITEPRAPHHIGRIGEYRNVRGIPFIRAARKRGGDGTESLMFELRRFGRQLGLAAILSAATATSCFAQPTIQEPSVYAANETATRPWSAPVGHRQPHAADVPATTATSQQIIDQEDAMVDRRIRGICRGC